MVGHKSDRYDLGVWNIVDKAFSHEMFSLEKKFRAKNSPWDHRFKDLAIYSDLFRTDFRILKLLKPLN